MNDDRPNSDFTRVIIDSQSNPHFLGEVQEQRFDQRAALSQGRSGDIVVTTDPIDPLYIDYWKSLGFTIPTLIVAGPFQKEKVLSQLIFDKPEIQDEIMRNLNGSPPRVEFFTPSNPEEILAKHLGLPAYLNFDFAKEMQKKSNFKKLCAELEISTLPYVALNKDLKWKQLIEILGESHNGYIAKHIFGTGGAGLGTIIPIQTKEEFLSLDGSEDYIIEKLIPVAMEISMHWEIDFNHKVHFINCFEQLAENVSYVGTVFPTQIPEALYNSIYSEYEILTNKISELGGLGYMCCDVLVDENGNFYWSDLNPRKGAILFIYDAVRRFRKNHNLLDQEYFVRHKHIKIGAESFEEVKELLGYRLRLYPNGIILITNPGIIEFGMLDVTALSFLSHENASLMLREVEEILLRRS